MGIPKFPQLPTEMIEAILDNLHDDNKTLKSCSLVCKDWIDPARRLLFSTWTLHLYYHAGAYGANEIDRSQKGPVVLPFLRRHLRISGHDNEDWHCDLPLLVGQNHVQSLRLFCPLGSYPFPTIRSPPTFLRNLSDVVILRLERISFSDLSALLEVLCGFLRLQTLSITTSTLKMYIPLSTTFQLSPNLVALEFGMRLGMDQILEWFLALADPPSFLSVCLSHSEAINLDLMRKFIATLKRSVKHLSFPIYGPSSPPLNLSHFTPLRSIEFSLWCPTFAKSLPGFLSHLPAHLDMVAFELQYWEYPGSGSQAGWEEVDALLQGSLFEGLKKVHVASSTRITDVAVDYISRCMPQCQARGILRICEGKRFYGIGSDGLPGTYRCGLDLRDHQ